jgi:hypothetical protein
MSSGLDRCSQWKPWQVWVAALLASPKAAWMMGSRDEWDNFRVEAPFNGGSGGRSGFAALLASPKAAWMVVGRGERDDFRAEAPFR